MLLVNVVLSMLVVFSMKSAPPSIATLPEKVLVVMVSEPLLAIAPPEVPLNAGDWLPENVLPLTTKVPWLLTAPPPL